MTLPSYAAQRDANEPLIVRALEDAGWVVVKVNMRGFPDLICGKGETVLLIEVIGPAKAKKYRNSGGLTDDQVEFHGRWPGTIHLVRTVAEALAAVAWAE